MIRPLPGLLSLSLAGVLAGCSVGPNFTASTPDVPAGWSVSAAPVLADQASRLTSARAPESAWWNGFGDAELTSLIARAAAANLDAKQAVLRITEARAQRDIAGAAARPSLGLDASSQVTRLSQSTPTGTLFSSVGQSPALGHASIPNPYYQQQLGFDAAWEIDLFGRVRRSVEAANADTQASIEDSRAVQITIFGEVARTFIHLRGAQAVHQLVTGSIATEQDLLELAGQRQAAGLSSQIDVVRIAAEASGARAQLPPLDQQITAESNMLCQLLGLPPGALRPELQTAVGIPPLPPSVPIGLPADLARRRPDIRAAEARLHAATARIGVAVAALYPKLSLGASGGVQAQTIAGLAAWASRFFSAGPTLTLPIFDGGRLRATVRLQDAAANEAALAYRNTVLSALREADDALAAYGNDQARQRALGDADARNQEAVQMARQRYAAGVGSFIDVLDAERSRQQNALLLAGATAQVSTDLIVLYKALGGGWDAA
jgi:multidrug efflux system outer membrane protein